MKNDTNDKLPEMAELTIRGKTIKLPVYEGAEGELGIDIKDLRSETACVTLDPGYVNTGSCTSSVTFINGEEGILRHRGIPISDFAEQSNFLEISYLLINGKLPNQREFDQFKNDITRHSMIHEDMKHFFNGYPRTAHPMSILSSMVCSLSDYYPDCFDNDPKTFDRNVYRILSKISTIAAFSYKKSIGQPYVEPLNKLSYVENFLNMMFSIPAEDYKIDQASVEAIEMILVLHADHEQNCSTSTVRMVGSSQANLYASISAGICALWGRLHGGANQAVIEMLNQIISEGGDVRKFIQHVKDGQKSGNRLSGFGHRVYKHFDPRAKILKKACDKVLHKLGANDELFEIAKKLEESALKDEFFIQRKLYPNVDFYSGIILQAIGIPLNMFPVIFAIGRLPGWITHWKEQNDSGAKKICRPRQIYTGSNEAPYIPISKR